MRLCKLNALSHLQLLFGHFDLVQNPASRVSRSLGRRVETGYSSRHQLNCNNFQRCQIIERAPATCRFAFFFPFLVILLFFASSALLWDPRMHFCSCLLLQRRGFWCWFEQAKEKALFVALRFTHGTFAIWAKNSGREAVFRTALKYPDVFLQISDVVLVCRDHCYAFISCRGRAN